jgi:C-terminal processing protease CtpA/Prc
MDRGEIVGQSTGGSTGQPLVIHLPGGGSARICSKRDRYPDGTEFVGVGVKPDIEIEPTIADFRSGRDAAVERALELMGK